jgi:hypothetical protein
MKVNLNPELEYELRGCEEIVATARATKGLATKFTRITKDPEASWPIFSHALRSEKREA